MSLPQTAPKVKQPSMVARLHTVNTETKPTCEDSILATLCAIHPNPNAVFELSNLITGYNGKAVMQKGYFNDRRLLAEEAAALTDNDNSIAIYINVQEIDPECIHRAENRMRVGLQAVTKADVTDNVNFVVDVDREGTKGISATEEEKKAIFAQLTAIRNYLTTDLGWPDIKLKADSGNGGHLIWGLDLPNTPENEALINLCLKALAQRFNTAQYKVDTSMGDPNQLIKLYGTMTRKGDDTAKRPHRRSAVLDVVETQPVSLKQLQALAATYTDEKTTTTRTTGTKKLGRGKWWRAEDPALVEAWAAEHELALGEAKTGAGMIAWWPVDCLTSDEHTDGAKLILYADGYLQYKCHHDSCADKKISDILEMYPRPQDTPDDQPKSKHATWGDYVNALGQLGYTFAINDMNEELEVNNATASDGLEAEMLMRMHDKGFKKPDVVRRAWLAEGHQNRFHPIKEFFDSLTWDGIDRIAELDTYVTDEHPAIIYDTGEIVSVFYALLRRWGVGAVSKILRGTQNPMLVWGGPQDLGKSTLVKWLCPLDEEKFFLEEAIEPDTNEHKRLLCSRLMWEVGELGATVRKADIEALKNFMTKSTSTYRLPYGRNIVTKQAICSFIGTINPTTGFLRDPTGYRRFNPLLLKRIDHSYSHKIDKVQLWAQFVALCAAGEPVRLTEEERKAVEPIRKGQEIEDPIAGFIVKYFDVDPERTDWSTPTRDVVALLVNEKVPGANITSVGLALTTLHCPRVSTRAPVTWGGITLKHVYRTNPGEVRLTRG